MSAPHRGVTPRSQTADDRRQAALPKLNAIIFTGMLLLSGCHRGVGVEAAELPSGRIAVFASESWRFDRPCVNQVRIFHIVEGRRQEYWNIAVKDLAKCVGAFAYPAVPPGYEIIVRPREPLRAGEVLEVEISGAGFANSTVITKR